ncbi:MAG: tail fiber domain-containing protein [Candidatus Saccharimonas sp.]|nr:tail fiber domain-containing protein [Planctomycetaceae bacterium]
MSREIASVTMVVGRCASARRLALKLARTAGAIALGLSWVVVGMADEVTSPANINATVDPIAAFKQAGNGMAIPPYTWQIRGNDIDFSIIDITGTTTPLRIAGATPNDTLRLVRDTLGVGNVGINGVPDDLIHLQVNASSTPTIRFSQTGGTPYKWDLVANEANWFVRDSTGGSDVPLLVAAGAPAGALWVKADGSVGMGILIPDANSKVDIRSTAKNNGMLMKRADAGPHYLRIEDSSGSAFRCGVQGSGDAQFGALTAGKGLNLLAGGTTKLLMNSTGQVSFGNTPPAITSHAILHQSGANLTLAGVWTNASSRALKQDIEPITSEEARDTVRALQPVGYRYKSELNERYVGFIAEDVPELVATNDRKGLAPMDITAVLTKVVQDQDHELSEARRMIADLSDRLLKLEQQLGNRDTTDAAK